MENQTVTVTETITPTEPVSVTAPVEETDEDYKWLTERLDAHTLKLTELITEVRKLAELSSQQSMQTMEESRTLIHALTEMVKSQGESLTALAASATLQSTRPVLETTSNSNPPEITAEIVEPESSVPMRESQGELVAVQESKRRFRRL